jgi:hypothetical protein
MKEGLSQTTMDIRPRWLGIAPFLRYLPEYRMEGEK